MAYPVANGFYVRLAEDVPGMKRHVVLDIQLIDLHSEAVTRVEVPLVGIAIDALQQVLEMAQAKLRECPETEPGVLRLENWSPL